MNTGSNNYGPYGDTNYQGYTNYGGTGDYYNGAQDEYTGNAPSGGDEKACPACTFANTPYSVCCEICGTTL